jgi:hypothetical protein
MIPKNLFQTYYCDYKDLPSYVKNCTETWQQNNPDFNYIYMSETECHKWLLENYNPQYARAYEMLKHKAQKGDLWRYSIVNKLGGIYMDIDTVCRRPISDVIDYNYNFVTSLELDKNSMFTQWGFGGQANNSILTNLTNYIIENVAGWPDNQNSLKTDLTGPVSFQKAVVSVLGSDADPIVNLMDFHNNNVVDFGITWEDHIKNAVEEINNSPAAQKEKFGLYTYNFNQVGRHFMSSQRWTDNSIGKPGIVTQILGRKPRQINSDYAEVKIYLKNRPGYNSFGGV